MTALRRVSLALFCCALWGSAVPFTKISMGLFSITPRAFADQIFIAGLRFSLAGFGTIIVFSLLAGRFLLPDKNALKTALWLAMFQTVGQYTFYYIGLSNASGVNASLVQSSNVFIAFLLSCFIFKQESFTGIKLFGCLLGFSGILLMYVGSLKGQIHFSFLGEGLILVSTFFAAMSVCLLKKLSGQFSPLILSGYQFLFGGLIMLFGGASLGGHVPTSHPTGFTILFYLAFVSTAAYSLWGYLLRHNPVSSIAIFGCTTPMFGTLFSCIFLKEVSNLNWNVAGELVCAVLSIYLINYVGEKSRVQKSLAQ
ncbi:MAG: DMT family transporter [Candidatus Fimivivens sp.]|nr:DMT family transporter [Candidatus Fimivivens sp.]